MEQPIQFDPLESQIRECYGRVVYSHKVHEKCSDIFLKRLNLIKISQISLSALTTGSLLVTLFGEDKVSAIIATLLSALLLGLNAYTKDYDLGELAQKHADTAARLWEIRESYLSFLTDIKLGDQSIENIRARRDELQNSLQSIYQNSPRTNKRAYKEAQKALCLKEEMTFSDKEIDNFLPKSLRRTKADTPETD